MHAFAKLLKATFSFFICLLVRQSVPWNNSDPIGQMFIKCDTSVGLLPENLPRKFKFSENLTRMMGTYMKTYILHFLFFLLLLLLLLLLLPLALQFTVGFGLSNNVLPFFPICHHLSPSSHSQHLKISFYFLFPSFPGSSPSRPFQFLSEDLFEYPILLHSLQVT